MMSNNRRNNLSPRDKFGLLTIFLALNWIGLSQFYLHFDSAARIPILAICVSLLIFRYEIKSIALKVPITLYLMLVTFIFINGLLKGSLSIFAKDPLWLYSRALFQTPAIMLLAIVLLYRNFDLSLKYITYAFLFYCIMMIVNLYQGADTRMYSEQINGNDIAFNSALTLGFSLICINRQIFKNVYRPFAVIIPFLTCLMTGSRMGLAMMLIILIFLGGSMNFRKAKNIIMMLFFAVFIFFIFDYIINNTLVGERLLGTKEQGENFNLSTGTPLDYLGDRGFQYYFSWPYFLENPLTGIGYGNWIKYNPQNIVCHSEYLVQYLENGLLSFVPYLFFLGGLLKKNVDVLKKRKGIERKTLVLLLGMLIAVVYANFVLYSYNIFGAFILYSLVYSYPLILNYNEKKQYFISSR